MSLHQGHSGASKQALYTEASNLLKKREYSEALKLYTKLIEVYPDSARSYRGRALCLMGLNDFSSAKLDIEQWIANQQRRSSPDADAYYHLGECLRALGDESGAVEAIETALSINPIHTRAIRALSEGNG